MRFPQRHLDAAGEPGEEERALDLRARDRHLVPERREPAAPHRQREPVAPVLGEAGAHPRERPGDTAHRSPAERRVPGQRGGEPMAGQQAEQEPGAGAGIPAVQRLLGAAQPAAALDGYHGARPERRYARAELAQDPHRKHDFARGVPLVVV